jgi:hypothetical protein
MAEDPSPKDKWYAWSGVMAYTFPLTEEVHEGPSILFGPGSVSQERYDDEEIQGGKITLIAVKQMRAQKPPNSLDRMQSTYSKKVAYNQRILEAESEIAGINLEIPQLLEDMTLEEPVYVCINSSEEMDRDEQSIAGQLWIQADRHMAVSNVVPDGMADTKDSALLAAAAEAVSWNHASQPDQPRKGQRVIIYPRDLTRLEDFLSTGDPNVDPEDDHPLAYATILQESAKFQVTPMFLNEDSEPITSDPFFSEKVPEWMARTKQVATGCRRRTLETRRDVENSDDEDDEELKPDELTGTYTAEMDPKAGPKVLTTAEAAFQRAAGRALKEQSSSVPKGVPRSDSPIEDWMNERERRFAEVAARKLAEAPAIPRPATRTSEPEIQPPAKAVPLKIVKASAVSTADLPEGLKKAVTKETKAGLSDTKAAASPRAPADQPTGAKAPSRKTGQESPGTQVPSPMETRARKKAIRAGGLRGVKGLGQTESDVDHKGPPPKPRS